MKNKLLLLLLFACFLPLATCAQADRKYIRNGNKQFHQKEFNQAEQFYRQALAVNANNAVAHYNLGCALLMQQKDSLAAQQFERAGKMSTDKYRRAMAYHNLGVLLQNHQQYGQAIEAYKESLRANPDDNETRYNLALCQKLQKKRPQNQQKQQQSQQQKKNQQNQQQENKDQQQNKNNPNEQDNNQKDNSQPEQMSKENAEQMLNAVLQKEKRTKEKVDKAMKAGSRKRLEKNW